MAVDWEQRRRSIEAGRRARTKMLRERREARWLAAEVAAGRVCGDHDRPRPCQECAE